MRYQIHYWWRFCFGFGTYGKGDYHRHMQVAYLGYWGPQQRYYPSDSSKWRVCAFHLSIPLPFFKAGFDSFGKELRHNLRLSFRYA